MDLNCRYESHQTHFLPLAGIKQPLCLGTKSQGECILLMLSETDAQIDFRKIIGTILKHKCGILTNFFVLISSLKRN
jgi:hypothetical protein